MDRMTQRTQFDRSSVTTERTSGQPVGTPFVNFADLVLQVEGPTGPVDLLAVRRFATTATYEAGDIVVYNGGLYTANGAITPGAFDALEWTSLVTTVFSAFVGEVGWDWTITYTDGNATEILYEAGDLQVRETLTYDADDNVETVQYETSTNAGVAWTDVGTMTIAYNSDGDATTGTWA
jgi:hypothetical protein